MASSPATVDSNLPLHRLSVGQYHAMRDAGILGPDDRVEFLDGLLVPKVTKNPPHRLVTKLLRSALEGAVPSTFYVDSQEPVTTADSEPEPDIVVVRGAPRDYADRHPEAKDVVLVVEIADESLPRDRGTKLALYARAGVTRYWIVNLRARAIEVYTEPVGDAFSVRAEFVSGSAVPVVLDGVTLAHLEVDAVLP